MANIVQVEAHSLGLAILDIVVWAPERVTACTANTVSHPDKQTTASHAGVL